MKFKARETAMEVRKVLVFSVKTSYRGVHDHPFLAGFAFFLFLLFHSHPFLFACLVNSSPVIICTTLLLGTLLSYGDLNVPEIEEEDKKIADDVSAPQVRSILDDLVIERGSKVSFENRVVALAESSLQHEAPGGVAFIQKDDACYAENSLEFRTTEGKQSERKEGQEFSEMLDDLERVEFLTAYDEGEKRENIVCGTSSDVEREVAREEDKHSTDFFEKAHYHGENEDGGSALKVGKCASGLVDQSVAIQDVTTESSEPKPDGSFYSLLRSSKEPVVGPGDFSDSSSDGAESSSPDASMADILPVLDELHPLLDSEHSRPVHIRIDDSDGTSEVSLEDERSDYTSDDAAQNHEDDVPRENGNLTRGLVEWTEDDLKNVMDIGTSELERNRRLENLIAKRIARKNAEVGRLMGLDQNEPFSTLEKYSHLQISPVRTRKVNPFDHLNDTEDMKDLPPIPASAPSVLLEGRSPFEFHFNHGIDNGCSHHQLTPGEQGNAPSRAFTRFGSKDTNFGYDQKKKVDAKFRPYFVPEKIFSDDERCAQFQRQSSEMSNSKLSSVPEYEVISPVPDQDYPEGLVEHEESEVISPIQQDGIATVEYDQEEREINLGSCYESIHNSSAMKEAQASGVPSVPETGEIRVEELPISYAPESEAVEDKYIDENPDETFIRLDDTILKRMNSSRFMFNSVSSDSTSTRRKTGEMDEAQETKLSSSDLNNDNNDAGFIPLDDTILKRINSNRYFFTEPVSKDSTSESRNIEEMGEAKAESLSSETTNDNADGGFIRLDDTILRRMNTNRYFFTESVPKDSPESRKTENVDDMQHADIRYSSLPAIETSTFDGDLLEPLLSPDNVNATEQQAIFKTYLTQRSTKIQMDEDFVLQNENMLEDLSEMEIVHPRETDKAKFAGMDMTGKHLSSGNEEKEVSSFSMDGLIIHDYLTFDSSQKTSLALDEPPLQSSDSRIQSIVTTTLPSKTEETLPDTKHEEQKGVYATGRQDIEESKGAFAEVEQERFIIDEETKEKVDQCTMGADDESVISPAAFTQDDGSRGNCITQPVRSADIFNFPEGESENPKIYSSTNLANTHAELKREHETNSMQHSNDLVDSDKTDAESNEFKVDENLLTELDAVSDYSLLDLTLDGSKSDQRLHLYGHTDEDTEDSAVFAGKEIPLFDTSKGTPSDIAFEDSKVTKSKGESRDSIVELESIEDISKLPTVEASPIERVDREVGIPSLESIVEKPLTVSPTGLAKMEFPSDYPHVISHEESFIMKAKVMEDSNSSSKQPKENKIIDTESEGDSSNMQEGEAHAVEDLHILKQPQNVAAESPVGNTGTPNLEQDKAHPVLEVDSALHEVEISSVDGINLDMDHTKGVIKQPHEQENIPIMEMEIHSKTEQLEVHSGEKGSMPPQDMPMSGSIEIPQAQTSTGKENLEPVDIDKSHTETEVWHLDDIQPSLKPHAEDEHSEKAKFHPTLHEIEAQSTEDIHSAMKQFSEEVKNDTAVGISTTETHEIKAEPSEDVHVGQKQFSEGSFDDPGKLTDSQPVSSETEATEKYMDSDVKINPNLCEVNLHEDEPHSPENMCVTLSQPSEGSADVPKNVSEPKSTTSATELQPSVETDSYMHEVEAHSYEDIMALRQLSMKISESTEDEDRFEDVSSELDATEYQVESDIVVQSDLHEVEARSLEDINLAVKKYSREMSVNFDEEVEGKGVSSNDGVVFGFIESNIHEVQNDFSHVGNVTAETVSAEKPALLKQDAIDTATSASSTN